MLIIVKYTFSEPSIEQDPSILCCSPFQLSIFSYMSRTLC